VGFPVRPIGQTGPVAGTRKAPPGVDVRLALLDAAGELLLSEGTEGMTTRLASMAGTTTQAIDTEFGGKEGIARAMYREGFARLEACIRDVGHTADPFVDLLQQGRAYRASALERPHFYAVMFGRPIPEFSPGAEDLAASRIVNDLLSEGIERVIATGALAPAARADDIAQWLWAVVHGVVSLELTGAIEIDAATYDEYLRLSLIGFLRESGRPPVGPGPSVGQGAADQQQQQQQ
jgi:AcrR family transcriptional regulator